MANQSRAHENFVRYYQQYKNSIFNYVFYRVGFDRQTAEDLTSEIFLKAYENFYRYDPNRPFKTWIFTIAHNHLINFIYSKKKTISLDDAREVPREDTNPNDLDAKMLKEKVLDCVDKLPPAQREIVMMRYVNDLEYPQIAEILGKNEGAIRTTLSRAINYLRETCSNQPYEQ